MRWSALVLVLAVACPGGSVSSPPLVIPSTPDDPEGGAGFAIDPAAPYARLFVEGAHWTLPATTWVGAGDAPTVTCTVSAVRALATARVAYLACRPERELGPAATALPAYGVVATAAGLWITSNAAQVTAPPESEDEAVTLTTQQPMRMAAVPAPLHASRQVEGVGANGLRIDTTIDLAARRDAWCLSDENTAATETVTSVLCVHAQRGVVGLLAVYRSRGIVIEALTAGDAPAPPASAPLSIEPPVPAEQVTLDAPGKGKRAPLVLSAAAGTSQTVEYVIDGRFRSRVADQPVAEQTNPTITLRGVARVESVEPDGSFRYRFTVEGATSAGAGDPALASGLATLVGMVLEATVGRDGRLVRYALTVPHPTAATADILALVAQSLPPWSALPTEPIAVGARWTTRHARALFGIEVEVTHRSRLTERKGGRAVIVSESSIEPLERTVGTDVARLVARGGTSTQMVDGTLVPIRIVEQTLVTSLTPGAGSPSPPKQSELITRTRILPK